ncbi:MAG: prolyl oligopeptidase family serine peptidase [Candidatus Dependentiae bacterium]|nr:prolyl oligopeptidase family serine peptidase [Candidatus Dependentiae bacterium]
MKKLLTFIIFMISSQAIWPEQIKTIFAHGIVDGPSQINRFDQAIATKEKYSVSFLDATDATGFGLNYGIFMLTKLFGKHVNRSKMYMAQGPDINSLHKFIDAQSKPGNGIILYGCSRGSATILNYLKKHDHQEIKALVLDACPASMHEAIQPTLIKYGINPSRALSVFTTLFPKYPTVNPITPLDSIKNIKNKNLPILLIHSLDDTVVPFEHGLMLYQEFIENGFKNVHFISIPSGKHSFLLQGKNSKKPYLQAVHSFYKKYNLPFNELFATTNLANHALDGQKVINKINAYKNLINKKALLISKN